MKEFHFFIAGIILFFMSCKDNSTATTVHDNLNSPVTTNVVNSFTYSINASSYSVHSQNDLSFLSDSLVVTLLSSGYSSGKAIVLVRDSSSTSIFADTITSNKTIVITNLKTTKPRYCTLDVTNLTAKFTFTVIGQ